MPSTINITVISKGCDQFYYSTTPLNIFTPTKDIHSCGGYSIFIRPNDGARFMVLEASGTGDIWHLQLEIDAIMSTELKKEMAVITGGIRTYASNKTDEKHYRCIFFRSKTMSKEKNDLLFNSTAWTAFTIMLKNQIFGKIQVQPKPKPLVPIWPQQTVPSASKCTGHPQKLGPVCQGILFTNKPVDNKEPFPAALNNMAQAAFNFS